MQQRRTIGSFKRSLFDVMRRETYAEIDSTARRKATPDEADVETVRRFGFEPGRAFNMTPNALAAKPVDASTLNPDPDGVKVEVDLTPAASVITFLIGFVIALNLISLIVTLLLPVLLGVFGPLVIIGAPLAVLVALLASIGLAWLFIQVVHAQANNLANSIARDALSSRETLGTIADALDQAGVMNYAGEGLAEAIAVKAIQQAGHAVEPPTHEQPDPDNPGSNRRPSGRERFRPQFFETIVVGPGKCRVLLRVP
jgi:hypothetical protein